MKKIKFGFLAVVLAWSMCFGVLGRASVFAEDFSLVPTGEVYELKAGQAKSFMVSANVEGIRQAVTALESQNACQEKVCVCNYQVKVVTLRVLEGGAIEQVGVSNSTERGCRDMIGGAEATNIAYGVSVAEPGNNYYLNIFQTVSTEGASFGNDGAVRTLGGVEVHQLNVVGAGAASGDSTVTEPPRNDAIDSTPVPDEVPGASEPVVEEPPVDNATPEEGGNLENDTVTVDDSADWEHEVSAGEYELAWGEDGLAEALANETTSTFTLKVDDGAMVPVSVLGSVKESGKNLSIKHYQDDKLIYEWKMRNAQINTLTDFNPGVVLSTEERPTVDEAMAKKQVVGATDKLYLHLAQEGALPNGTKLKIALDESFIESGANLNLYNYDQDLDEIELAYESIRIDGGYAEFAVTHGADGYFLTPAQIVVVPPVEDNEDEAPLVAKETNWVLVGSLAVAGLLAVGGGVAGFWYLRKRKPGTAGSKKLGGLERAVPESQDDVSEDDDNMVEDVTDDLVPLEQPMGHAAMVRQSTHHGKTMDVMGGAKHSAPAGRSMDMVAPGSMHKMIAAPSNNIIVTDGEEVAMKGSPKRLVIS